MTAALSHHGASTRAPPAQAAHEATCKVLDEKRARQSTEMMPRGRGSVGIVLHFMFDAWSYTSAPGYLQGDCRPGPKAPVLLRYATLCNFRALSSLQLTLEHASMPLVQEAPNEEDHDDGSKGRNRSILLQQQLPINPHSRTLVLRRVLAQPTAHISHLLQAITAVKQVVDVLCENGAHALELFIQILQIRLRAAVLVRLLCALDVALELGVRVWAEHRVEVGIALVGVLEFFADVFEVCLCELFGVCVLGDAEEGEVIVEGIAVGLLSAPLAYCSPKGRRSRAWPTA